MSIIWSNEDGWILCHSQYLHEVYDDLEQNIDFCSVCQKHRIFHIHMPFLKYGQKAYHGTLYELVTSQSENESCKLGNYLNENFKAEEIAILPRMFGTLMQKVAIRKLNYFSDNCCNSQCSNLLATEAAKEILKSVEGKLSMNYHGGNLNHKATSASLENETYFIPPNCEFYNCDINDMKEKLKHRSKFYDFVLVDPPWQNKHVKRKNVSSPYQGYSLMSVDNLTQLPINDCLSLDGLVAVWCTNSSQQIKDLINNIFPVWNIRYTCTWYWIKVTRSGRLICEFSSQENRKQPFERIIFGTRINSSRKFKNPPPNKMIVSIPSSIHSHKPPLSDVIKEYLPIKSRCIEFFARYLLPDWTSCGDEVLKLQHHLLFR